MTFSQAAAMAYQIGHTTGQDVSVKRIGGQWQVMPRR